MKQIRKQHGIADIALDAIIVLVVLAAISAAVYGVNSWWNGKMASAKEAGRQEVRLAVAKERNDQLVAAQTRIAELEAERAKKQDEHDAKMASIDQEGQNALKALQGKHDRFLDDLFAGRIRLPGQGGNRVAGSPGGGGEQGAQAQGGAGVGDGKAAGNIPAGFGAFLGSQAERADKVAVQLDACQKIVVEDRRACNE